MTTKSRTRQDEHLHVNESRYCLASRNNINLTGDAFVESNSRAYYVFIYNSTVAPRSTERV
ncbi:ORF-9 peptide [Chrysodeixis chalcites nucleopolyhedrovirus]|uniref:ORF-9 peptide n=1 Tax=Chrysodeixis chalcites nucleopolyhedrovirus TaxID=320432 RepID=Q4KT71_9ABAC|nr:ORF-9 peptide [Chrysodeixis chalcites nucleopolyhedrovirus]AGC36225.1 hypothetical protein TF1A_009 [Chrysodeixis chalcites SNPV TF1-A]AAY83940.1 ORF-9 peptide [Chrysodeixis chalcites nucleopolyhedrovirus]AGE61272.1 hypothetical protein [Chrysodeixis chalcites nucleopolyhedrovirus]AGE61421.1 hypothetical protein [Chrysodeixis chalcites nucleopolyhedrovirus]AGE61570.1 hypothetical protein [Chrysodeixis chalcites nucleopolyhedrovirus]